MNAKSELVTQEETLPVPASETNAIMALIERAATSSDVDVDKLDKLLSVKERWDAQQAKREYDQAMSLFRSKAPTIARKAQGHNSKYARLSDAIEQIKPALLDCGLSHSWRTEQSEGWITVTCVVTHVGGHSEKTSLSSPPDASGGKNNIQAIASTVSYLERYTLFAILGLSSAEMDDDGAGSDNTPVTDEEAARLRDELEAVGGDEKAFCTYMKVESLEQIPARKFESALKTIQRKKK